MTLESIRLEKGLNGWESVSVSETFSALSSILENLEDGTEDFNRFSPFPFGRTHNRIRSPR